jgi:hypothetical protein
MNLLLAFCRQECAAPPDAMLTEMRICGFRAGETYRDFHLSYNCDVNNFLSPVYACVRQGKSAGRYFYQTLLIKITNRPLLPYGQNLTN